MKKLLYILPALALMATSCSNKNGLEGSFKNSNNDKKTVYLLTVKDFESQPEPIDSTVVENGKFSFNLEGVAPGIGVGYVMIKDVAPGLQNGIPFFIENGKVKMEIDSLSRITGTPMNDKGQAFLDRLNAESKKGEELAKKIRATTDETEQQKYFAEMMSLDSVLVSTIHGFVKENISTKVGEFYLMQFIQSFDEKQIKELLPSTSPEFQKVFEKIMNPASAQKSFIGQQYIDITGLTPDDKKVSLSDYIGKNKVVLVDFWASWCGPCRVEMPNVVEAYAKYKSKGFEIVGVSLDEDKEAWTQGIKDMNMSWVQMSDLKGWKSELSSPYGIVSIPFTLLVDQDGKIIAENLRGTALDSKLEELLK